MTRQNVIDRLVALGLTTYEAKVFSALTGLGEAGVADIHAVAEVPRSAVYGTLEKLERMGIIEASTGRPKKFRALPPKVAISKIESDLLCAVKDAREGLEELASTPHRESSGVHIWLIRGRARVQRRLEEIVGLAKSELLVAGSPEHVLSFSGVWRRARSRKVKILFASPDPKKLSALSKCGEVMQPKYFVNMEDDNQPKILFVRADRRVILFASVYRDETQIEDMTAFWTDDEAIVRFLNYLTDSLSKPPKKARPATLG